MGNNCKFCGSDVEVVRFWSEDVCRKCVEPQLFDFNFPKCNACGKRFNRENMHYMGTGMHCSYCKKIPCDKCSR